MYVIHGKVYLKKVKIYPKLQSVALIREIRKERSGAEGTTPNRETPRIRIWRIRGVRLFDKAPIDLVSLGAIRFMFAGEMTDLLIHAVAVYG